MIPGSLWVRAQSQRFQERLPDDIRAYVRSEWGGDPSVLGPAVRRPPPPLGARVRVFLRSRLVRPGSAVPAAPSPVRIEPDLAAARRLPIAECAHPRTEYLGATGLTEFLRCLVCGDLFILQPGHAWQLQRSVP
ncbi:MAG TPA: hypothetical protein VEY12_09675 [Thermoplasmata archaeon]|nr:hypothetical protein [Thermoplasmata archaeon]